MLSSQDGCGGRGLPPSSSSCGDDCHVRDAKRWEMRADRVGDVARRQARVVLFGHPRVGVVPEINDITKEHPEHPAHPTAPQDMTKVQLPHHHGDFHFA